MKNIRLLIFDWDGTLMDSARKIINCFTGAATELDLEVPYDDSICDVIGLGLGEAFTTLYPDKRTISQLLDRYRQHFTSPRVSA